ncbi:MAG: GntR family transcriptional regulator, transcriptional repressor for pyruvate dehydrogenase complex [Actinomycetota bacterium]|nr:GntR family transcriptional regulator [Glaciihabitans sp.]MDQ1544645.1 GntR family transcriptional regulator, transcriptional repressor for pyruvate dehydrogenase complex [Actinomycetota bacterium]MDQ1561375.1 GntR family transcriptional regulator, transcriptional repressor for pyruvate dehydrogenase complex [Actinomycetota bacterium]MDQ1564634.1 GntR family transcriptional regulator, transcriptional repressor for pyruvate dehydrogenase complex [Actinomycetota bacterium]MDQ1574757.1 GntR fam
MTGGDAGIIALRPLIAETAAARIADRFVTAIALGHFVVGQRLPTIQELAKLLEVSPTTVREALGRLAALGYVSVQRGRNGGTFVTSQWGPASDSMVRRALEPGWNQLEVTLDFRSLIEQQIARTAALRHTVDDARRIVQAVRGYEAAGSDRETSRRADLELHQTIAAATQNSQLADLSLRIRRDVSLGFEAEPYNADVRARAIAQHAGLARAILDRKADEAARLAGEHFSLTAESLRELHSRVEHDDPPT